MFYLVLLFVLSVPIYQVVLPVILPLKMKLIIERSEREV
jgi:hypothetical protein